MSIEMASPTFGALLKAASVDVLDLAEFFAMLDLEDSHEVPEGLLTARRLLELKKDKLFRDYPTLLAQTPPQGVADSEGIRLTVDGLVFHGTVFTSLPNVSVIRFTEVINGDRRTGYTLTVGKVTQHDIDDPALLAANIRRLAGFMFHRVKPKAAEWSRYSTTTQLTRILAEPTSRCPHCQTRLRLRQGTMADRIPEPE